MSADALLTLNAGSSNIKVALFDSANISELKREKLVNVSDLQLWLASQHSHILAVSHRIVHGGKRFHDHTIITPETLNEIRALTPLAPLHQPAALTIIGESIALLPHAAHIACFDTVFHRTLPTLERRLPLPDEYFAAGMERYGFHGLSYEYITHHLQEEGNLPPRTIIAHLGSGCSMCAVKAGKSFATTMGFSTLEGLMMATRPGTLDAGLVMHLLQQKNMGAKAVEELFYRNCGLKGVSGISADMRELLANESENAKLAVEMFCNSAARHLGSLIMLLGGLDLLVFTGGVGENQPIIRSRICKYAKWLNISLSETANHHNDSIISSGESHIPVRVLPTNEEKMMALHTQRLTQKPSKQ